MRVTIGHLGAGCEQDLFEAGGMKYLRELQIMEIERRILAIESELGFLNPGGQFGGVPFPDPPASLDEGG